MFILDCLCWKNPLRMVCSNTSIYGHNDEVLVDDGNEASDSTENIPVMIVTPEEAIRMEKLLILSCHC